MRTRIPTALRKLIAGFGYFVISHIVALRRYCLISGFFALMGMLGRELNEWATSPKLATLAKALMATSMPSAGPQAFGPDQQGLDGLILVVGMFVMLGMYLGLSLYQSWARNTRSPAELTGALAVFLVLTNSFLRALRPPNLTVGLTILTIASIVATVLCVLIPWNLNRIEQERDKQFPPEARLAQYKSRQP